MNRIRKWAVLSVFGGGAILSPLGMGLIGNAPVHAATTALECTGTGAATPTPAVGLTGGSGTYTFSGPAHCTGSGEDDGNIVAQAVTISSSGDYSNIVCGTGGVTNGVSTVTLGDDTWTVNYKITFAGGQGALTGTASDSSDGDSGTLTVAGTASIVPTGGNCASGVTAFTVVYNIAAA